MLASQGRATRVGWLLFLFWISLGARPVAAQPEAPAELDSTATLEDFLRHAEAHSPALQAEYESWMAAMQTVSTAKGWPDPVLSYTAYLSAVETALGPQRHAIGLSQAIPWFGKLSRRGDAAERRALAAEQRYRQARLALGVRVAEAYYEYAYLARTEAITRETLELMRYQEGVARARYRTDSTRYSALVKAQVELGVLGDRLQSIVDQRPARAAALNAALGRGRDAALPWPVEISDSLEPIDEEALRRRMRASSPRLEARRHEAEGYAADADAARRDRYPDLVLGLKTILTDESELTNFDDRGRDAWMASVSVQLPLWRGKYDAAIRRAEARSRSAEHGVESATLDLEAEFEQRLFAFRDAGRKVQLYADNLVPKAEQALRATDTAYRAGDASFLDFVDAERTLLQFQLDLARARVDRGQQRARLLALAGAEPASLADDANTNEGTKR